MKQIKLLIRENLSYKQMEKLQGIYGAFYKYRLKYKYRERQVSYGKENEDKTFYVIRCIGKSAFFQHFNIILSHLIYVIVRNDFIERPKNVRVVKEFPGDTMNSELDFYIRIASKMPWIIKYKEFLKLLLRIFSPKYKKHESDNSHSCQLDCSDKVYGDAVKTVFTDYNIGKEDYVLFSYVEISELQAIHDFYNKIDTEKMPNTLISISEGTEALSAQSDADYSLGVVDAKVQMLLEELSNILNNKVSIITMGYYENDYFNYILSKKMRVVLAHQMSFGDIDENILLEKREEQFDNDVLNIASLGSFDSKHGAERLPNIIDKTLKLSMRKKYKISFNIKTEKKQTIVSAMREVYELLKQQNKNVVRCSDNENPLTTEEYFEYFHKQDIILLPYSSFFKYFSSGVLSEAYVLGKPVVVTAGTGLAREMKDDNYQYLKGVRKLYNFREVLAGREKTRIHGKNPIRILDNTNVLGCNYMLISMKINATEDRARKDKSVMLYIEEMDGTGNTYKGYERYIESNETDEALLLVRISDEVKSISVNAYNADAIYPVYIEDWHVLFTSADSIPLGSYGLSFYSDDEAAECLEDICLNYEHYRRNAKEHGAIWLYENCAATFIKQCIPMN